METTSSTDQPPVPRDALLELGLTDEQIDDALAKAPQVLARQAHLVDGAWFDVDAVAKVLKAFRALRHTKTRRWYGKPLDPEPWQVVWVIAPVFGWKHPDGTRIIRVLYVEVPRKNGKSTLSSGLGLVLLAADGEPGAEVYAAAGSRDQAKIVQGAAGKMVQSSPAFRQRVTVLRDVIEYPSTGSVFRALSRIAEAAHGLNVHGGIIDELHVHKSRDLVDAIETGTGARDQPLIVFITTADEGEDGTIYAEKHGYTEMVAAGTVQDASHYGVVWAASETDDPFARDTWVKCNPGLGVTVSEEYLAKEAGKAAKSPGYFPTFLRLHLNRRIRQRAKWFDPRHWDTGGMLVEPDLAGRACYGGIDLGNTRDFTAYGWLFPPLDDDPDGGKWKFLARLYLPEAAVERRGRLKNQILTWADQGWVTITTGTTADYDRIEADIMRDADRFDVVEVAYDPWNAPQLVKHLEEGGLTVWSLPQNMARLNTPSKQLDVWVANERLNTGGNPALRWMALNAITRGDSNGNIAPDKKHSEDNIDGIAALVNSVGAALREREEPDEPFFAVSAV